MKLMLSLKNVETLWATSGVSFDPALKTELLTGASKLNRLGWALLQHGVKSGSMWFMGVA